MVKMQKKNTKKNRNCKGYSKNRAKASKINASTGYETCRAIESIWRAFGVD